MGNGRFMLGWLMHVLQNVRSLMVSEYDGNQQDPAVVDLLLPHWIILYNPQPAVVQPVLMIGLLLG